MNNRLIKSNDAGGGGACTNTVDLYNPFPDGGGVALYQLNGDATDVSGNYDGTASNVTYSTGQFGQAGVFNGSSSYVQLPSLINFGLSSYTISLWFKVSNVNVFQSLFSTYGTPNNQGIIISQQSNGTVRFYASGGQTIAIATSELTVADTWYNVVCTMVHKGQARIYLNGELQNEYAAGTGTIGSDAGANPNIGRTPSGIAYTNGSIDQVRIFNRALRPYEVEALYTEEYCTPTIVPSEHFNTVTYTGNGSTQSITGVGFEPDFVWIKPRSFADNHVLADSARGINKSLASNTTSAENSLGITSFDSDGFSLPSWGNVTSNGNTFVSWNFKAGGAAVSNTDGTITSQVSANTEAGFSVVEYTAGGTANVGHGLDSAPAVIITKNLDISEQWFVYHKDVGTQKFLGLNTTSAAISNSGVYTSITDNTFTNNISGTSRTYINYCFAEVEGFSNFGSYVGTGASDNTVVTGFEPAFLLVKRTDSGDNWLVFDNKRSPSAPVNLALIPNSSSAEQIGNLGNGFTFLENGFNVISTDSGVNANGGSYIYMAFAADPTAVEPSLEDSFNTVLYTGNGGTQTIGGVFEGGGSFNGSSSNFSIDATATTPIDFSSENFTISMWLNPSSLSSLNTILGKYSQGSDSPTTKRTIIIRHTSSGEIQVTENDGSAVFVQLSTGTISANSWSFVSYVRESGSSHIYINNNSAETQSRTNTIKDGSVQPITIGGVRPNNAEFNGSIDQVRIFNTALTAAQVTELYEETDADSHTLDYPSGAGAVALYELNGNANDTGGTYNGTASNVTWLNNGTGFQPDLVWIKGRTFADNHNLADSVRGAEKYLFSNLTSQEFTSPNYLTSFDNNGFTVGSDNSSNKLNEDFVAWAWKAAELPAINSNGSITSIVSANPAAGFSIVKFTGNAVSGATIGHGLGDTPKIIIAKSLGGGTNWCTQFPSVIGAGNSLFLNSSAAVQNHGTGQSNRWTTTLPTSSVFSIGGSTELNDNGISAIAYCFAEVAGFSKFGSYAGNQSLNVANQLNFGFEPAFVLIKNSTSGNSQWMLLDSNRPNGYTLFPNTSGIEENYSGDYILSSSGIEFKSTNININRSGDTYIYMAFANQF